MENSDKIKLAVALCERHERAYGTAVPERIVRFISDGKSFAADGRCLPPDTALPGYAPGSVRLRATIPSWEIQCAFGSLDDAVVGPDGDWTNARRYLPLFVVDGSRLLVADLEDEGGPVMFFDEEEFGARQDRYEPRRLAASLDAFVAGLVDLDRANYETESRDAVWDMVASALGGDEE